MKKQAAVAAGVLALALGGVGAGTVVAQVAGPSTEVMSKPEVISHLVQPDEYAEGLTIGEVNVQYAAGCHSTATGIATTTRIGDRVVQDVVLTGGSGTAGEHCSRSGTVGTYGWSEWVSSLD